MADFLDSEQLKRNILSDMRVELTEEFDKNFERKAFFTNHWKKRADPNAKGSLLLVTGTLRRSIRSEVRGNGVRFTSAVPYASIHNEGGIGSKHVKAHVRRGKKGNTHQVKAHMRHFKMPQRQFIGDGKHTQDIIKKVISDNLKNYNIQLNGLFKQ
ncbi:MAG: phage virion morphogenesis protein [Bacteroidaceae bacterium]|nr:phage virion morphogenesis protein [Bacteroidaceae bacterium]